MQSYKCPSHDAFDWYTTKIKLMVLENRGRGKCKDLVEILQGTIRSIRDLEPNALEDCGDDDYEPCEDRCVPIGTCEILTGIPRSAGES